MTHELIEIFKAYKQAKNIGLESVLITVVHLNGSAYRKPGVRMLISQDGNMTGAVSGGCVEKEVWRESQRVFVSKTPKIITYDGRFRIGCEGMIHLLIEPFNPSKQLIERFYDWVKARKNFVLSAYYSLHIGDSYDYGTVFNLDVDIPLSDKMTSGSNLIFKQTLPPCFKLIVCGTGHDVTSLVQIASNCGWKVNVVAAYDDQVLIANFPGASALHYLSPKELDQLKIDNQTAVVLMTHNYAKDLYFLTRLSTLNPIYIGVLGATKRMNNLLDGLIETEEDISESFLSIIHGPAGLNIGAITPQEIAISIIAEITSIQHSNKSNQLVSSNTYENAIPEKQTTVSPA